MHSAEKTRQFRFKSPTTPKQDSNFHPPRTRTTVKRPWVGRGGKGILKLLILIGVKMLVIQNTHTVTAGYNVIGKLQFVKQGSLCHPVLSKAGRVGVKVLAVHLIQLHSFPRGNPPLGCLVTIPVHICSDNFNCAAVVLVRLESSEEEVWDGKHASRM